MLWQEFYLTPDPSRQSRRPVRPPPPPPPHPGFFSTCGRAAAIDPCVWQSQSWWRKLKLKRGDEKDKKLSVFLDLDSPFFFLSAMKLKARPVKVEQRPVEKMQKVHEDQKGFAALTIKKGKIFSIIRSYKVEVGPDHTRPYFWPVVNKWSTRIWPGTFLTHPEDIFLARREKIEKLGIFRGNFPKMADPNQATKNLPSPTWAYFWPAVNKRPTHLWPGYFLTHPEDIFFGSKRKKLIYFGFLGEIFHTQTKQRWLTWPEQQNIEPALATFDWQ